MSELEETLREAVRIIAPRENISATRTGQDFLVRARRALTSNPSPGFWPGDLPGGVPGVTDFEVVGPIGAGTPHARMEWFWERIRPHEDLVAELTGWSPVSSTYRLEAAIADAFDRLVAERRDHVAPEVIESGLEIARDQANGWRDNARAHSENSRLFLDRAQEAERQLALLREETRGVFASSSREPEPPGEKLDTPAARLAEKRRIASERTQDNAEDLGGYDG